jgi:hypothetical protein
MSPAQKRRRNVLIILVGIVIVTVGLAVLVDPVLWIAQVVADVLLAVYVYLLVQLTRHRSLASDEDDFWSSTPQSRSVGLAHPRIPARRELAPMPRASTPRRSAAG